MAFNISDSTTKFNQNYIIISAFGVFPNHLFDTIGDMWNNLYTFSKISFLVLALFTTAGVLLESIPKYESYGITYVILPLYLLSLAIPTSIRFFCSTLHAKAPVASDKS